MVQYAPDELGSGLTHVVVFDRNGTQEFIQDSFGCDEMASFNPNLRVFCGLMMLISRDENCYPVQGVNDDWSHHWSTP